MTNKEKAREILNKDIKSLSNFKTISHVGMATLRIPGAKKRLHRHLIDRAGNTGLSIGSMLAARKLKMNADNAIIYSKAGSELVRDVGVPTLGKMVIRK